VSSEEEEEEEEEKEEKEGGKEEEEEENNEDSKEDSFEEIDMVVETIPKPLLVKGEQNQFNIPESTAEEVGKFIPKRSEFVQRTEKTYKDCQKWILKLEESRCANSLGFFPEWPEYMKFGWARKVYETYIRIRKNHNEKVSRYQRIKNFTFIKGITGDKKLPMIAQKRLGKVKETKEEKEKEKKAPHKRKREDKKDGSEEESDGDGGKKSKKKQKKKQKNEEEKEKEKQEETERSFKVGKRTFTAEDVEALIEDRKALQVEVKQQKETIESLRDVNRSSDTKILEQSSTAHSTAVEMKRLVETNAQLTEQLNRLEASQIEVTTKLDLAQKEIKDLDSTKSDLEEKLGKAHKTVSNLEEKLKKYKELKKTAANLNLQVASLKGEIAGMKK
jgi:hypothetical protein